MVHVQNNKPNKNAKRLQEGSLNLQQLTIGAVSKMAAESMQHPIKVFYANQMILLPIVIKIVNKSRKMLR